MTEKESWTRLFFDAAFRTIVINSTVLQSKQNLSSSIQQAVWKLKKHRRLESRDIR
jgi:hypothetical protein